MQRNNQPETSILSYEKIMQPNVREGMYKKIILALEWIMDGTAWEIAAQCRCKPDKVWKRLSELRKDDCVIFDTGIRRLSPDGNEAMVYALSSRKEEYAHIPKPERQQKVTAVDYANAIIQISENQRKKKEAIVYKQPELF